MAKIFASKRKSTRNLTKNLNAENHKDCTIDFKIEKTAGLKLDCGDTLCLEVDLDVLCRCQKLFPKIGDLCQNFYRRGISRNLTCFDARKVDDTEYVESEYENTPCFDAPQGLA